jgi:hypothetical protein
MSSIPLVSWRRYLVLRGLMTDLIDLYAMPGVVCLRIAPGRVVEVFTDIPDDNFPLLALAFSRGRVELTPDDGRGPRGGAA